MASDHFPIHLFEEHSSTLPIWWTKRRTPRTAVYLDAHLDLQHIPAARLEALRQCSSYEEIKALESPHHLNQSPDYAYGIENFLHAASRLGLIERLVWVTPPHIPRNYTPQLLEYIQQMDGISFEELTGFRETENGALRGTLLGLDITLCDFEQLHGLDIPEHYYLDVDIDFFVRVPEDRLWIDPGKVIHRILEQLGTPEVATISRAIGSGFTPLAMRFVADHTEAILGKDQAAEQHYQSLYQALEALHQSQAQSAIFICTRAVDARPDCAAANYLLSLAMEQSGESQLEAGRIRARAIELDEVYAFDLGRAAAGFPNRHRKLEHRQLKELAARLPAEHDRAHDHDIVALARLYAASGQPGNALHLLRSVGDQLKHYSDILLEIAATILQTPDANKAIPLLEIARSVGKTRSMATLYLGDLAMTQGDTKRALHLYQSVSEQAPAWLTPLEKQATCHEQLANLVEQKRLVKLISKRKQYLAKLVTRSGQE